MLLEEPTGMECAESCTHAVTISAVSTHAINWCGYDLRSSGSVAGAGVDGNLDECSGEINWFIDDSFFPTALSDVVNRSGFVYYHKVVEHMWFTAQSESVATTVLWFVFKPMGKAESLSSLPDNPTIGAKPKNDIVDNIFLVSGDGRDRLGSNWRWRFVLCVGSFTQ